MATGVGPTYLASKGSAVIGRSHLFDEDCSWIFLVGFIDAFVVIVYGRRGRREAVFGFRFLYHCQAQAAKALAWK